MTEQETWGIQDSTKLQAYMNCARAYFFEYVLGWRKDEPSVHLGHGIAVHKAMECLYPVGGPDFSNDALANAWASYFEYYRSIFHEDSDIANSPKNPECTFRALSMYRNLYSPLDDFEVLHSEVAGTVLLDINGRKLYFKQDNICQDKNGRIFTLEHKTGTNFRALWALEWAQSIQLGTYCHVLFCMYPPKDVYGAYVNGIFIHEPPRIRKDGTPYANSKDTEFHRIPVAKTPRQMEDWAITVGHWLNLLDDDFEALSSCIDSDDIMAAFPKNTGACTKYFGCVYAPYCAAWLNPLQQADQPPIGFKIEHWDPRGKLAGAKEVVEL